MRKVISLMHMSLDGYAVGPKGEMDFIKFDEEVFSYVDRFIKGADAGIYGPKTFAMMEAHWPGVLQDPTATGHQKRHAQWYAAADKVVCSRSLKDLTHPSAKLVNADLPGVISALKARPAQNIVIFGSARLVHSFIALGLVDEFVMSISPVAIGSGVPLFKGFENRLHLELVEAVSFACGSIGCHYRRV